MGLFVGGDFGFVFEGGADVVEALEQDFFARWGDFEFVGQAVVIADGLIREINGERVALFFFYALEELFDLLLG